MLKEQPVSAINLVLSARKQFLAVFFFVLAGTYGILVAIDFIPEPPSDEVASELSAETVASASISELNAVEDGAEENVAVLPNGTTEADERQISQSDSTDALPLRMSIDTLDRTIPILNPNSRVIAELDAALERGAVRHPDAADFEREGNMLILGHSSRLPNVMNRNFQIFNDIETLQWGDTIRVFSASYEYVYRVDRVYEAKASQLVIPIADTGPRLTLATCDSFGTIDDRFIVEAELVSVRPIAAL